MIITSVVLTSVCERSSVFLRWGFLACAPKLAFGVVPVLAFCQVGASKCKHRLEERYEKNFVSGMEYRK